MIEAPTLDWWALAPELVAGVGAIVLLLVGVIVPRGVARTVVPVLAIAALLGVAFTAGVQWDTPRLDAFSGQVDSDRLAHVVRILAAAAGIATVLFSLRTRPDDTRDAEHYSLILAAVCGMGLFGAAGSLPSLFVGIELFSISLYVLCALEAERIRSLEAGLKYLVLGGLGAGVMLYGSALVYGATGTLDLGQIGDSPDGGMLLFAGSVMLIAALAFKASAAPLHWWTPDVYDGSPTSVTAFMATATKVAAFVALTRVLLEGFGPDTPDWQPLVAALAAISIVVGNVGALVQNRIKRMLAYSSIAHAGYLLIGVVAWQTLGVAALLFALLVYVAMSLGAFALVMLRERQLGHELTFGDLRGSGWSWGLSGIAMVVVMLSLAGLPPTGGFMAKFGLFQAALESRYVWLAAVGIVGSIVSLAYYLRVPIAMYMQDAVDRRGDVAEVVAAPASATTPVYGEAAPEMIVRPRPASEREPLLAGLGIVFAAATLGLGLAPDPALDAARDAAGDFITAADPAGEAQAADDDGS